MNTYAKLRIATATLAVMTTFGAVAPAYAAGVLAGTAIENTASASYSTAGGPTLSVDSNTVTVTVDELLDVAVASQDAAPVALSGNAVLSYSVTNTGNGPESFVLTANPTVTGNQFDATVTGLAIDTNGNGVYDPGTDAALANGGTSPVIAPDASQTVFVLVSTPSGTADGSTSQVNLVAAASTGTGTPGAVYPGAGAGGSNAVVGASGGDDDALGALIARVASVALVKSATIVDPFGGSQPVPGATVTYRIVATVNGTGAVDGLTITDNFPAGTEYVAGSLKLDNGGLTDAADTDAGTASTTGISVVPGTTAAGASRTVTFDVKIKSTP